MIGIWGLRGLHLVLLQGPGPEAYYLHIATMFNSMSEVILRDGKTGENSVTNGTIFEKSVLENPLYMM